MEAVLGYLRFGLILGTSLLMAWNPSHANEAVTYSYDALGRLVQVNSQRDSHPQAIITQFGFDAAGNRTIVTVTGATSDAGGGSGGENGDGAAVTTKPIFVVLPLNGYTIIPIRQ